MDNFRSPISPWMVAILIASVLFVIVGIIFAIKARPTLQQFPVPLPIPLTPIQSRLL